ncbi:hypothetical protein GN109_25320 [Collimonas pratensis]|nr:hypothetical protein [Collimonas pratensis]
MASNRKQFLLRLDPKLWAELEALAAQELRSVNAQIEYLLRDSLVKHRRFVPPASDDDDEN